MTSTRLRQFAATLLVVLGSLFFAPAAMAASCSIATSQGATGPAGWQTYCWIDLSTYNDTTARSAFGQNMSLSLQDGTVVRFNLKVTSGSALNTLPAPSWSGAAIGNTAFLGIAGEPVIYQTNGGTSTIVMSNIVLTPPPGATGGTQYMIVAADGESTNDNETLRFVTNGGNWSLLDQVGPISGSTYPGQSGTGTNTFTETGVGGTVGAYIVGS
ncbi:MAG: CshA/CshB family fibrillar adhesin-related protein, partial [Sphingomonas bacterium]